MDGLLDLGQDQSAVVRLKHFEVVDEHVDCRRVEIVLAAQIEDHDAVVGLVVGNGELLLEVLR